MIFNNKVYTQHIPSCTIGRVEEYMPTHRKGYSEKNKAFSFC